MSKNAMAAFDANTRIAKKTARVFFALWPDQLAQEQLGEMAQRLQSVGGGRRTRTETIHLTLVFLGEVASSRLDALRLAADAIESNRARGFDLVIDEIRYWKHNRIAWAGARKIPQELLALVNALQNSLATAGFAFDKQAYVPHITLVRKARCHELPDLAEPIVWRAREWVLVQSEPASDGSVYTPIGRWTLA